MKFSVAMAALTVGLTAMPVQAANNDFVIGEWNCDNAALNGVSYQDAGIYRANNQMRVSVRTNGSFFISEHLTNAWGRNEDFGKDLYSYDGSPYKQVPDFDVHISGNWSFDGRVLHINPSTTQLCRNGRCWNTRPQYQQYRLIGDDVLDADGSASLCKKVSGPRPRSNARTQQQLPYGGWTTPNPNPTGDSGNAAFKQYMCARAQRDAAQCDSLTRTSPTDAGLAMTCARQKSEVFQYCY